MTFFFSGGRVCAHRAEGNDARARARRRRRQDAAWEEAVDESTHLTYYYNKQTKEVVWDPPEHSNVAWKTWHDEVDDEF